VDRSGRPAIDGKFLDPQPFEDGAARVSSAKDGRVGLIDRRGKLLSDYRYDFTQPFAGGCARTNVGGVMKNGFPDGGQWGLVAADGRVIVEPSWDLLLDVGDGRLVAVRGNLSGWSR
jgi:hypothetical protein